MVALWCTDVDNISILIIGIGGNGLQPRFFFILCQSTVDEFLLFYPSTRFIVTVVEFTQDGFLGNLFGREGNCFLLLL